MNCLLGPLWRIDIVGHELRLLFLDAGVTRHCQTTIAQMIDPQSAHAVSYRGCKWVVENGAQILRARVGHRFAGNTMLVFRVMERVDGSSYTPPVPWDGPCGVVLHCSRFDYELIPCSMREYRHIPTQHACEVA